MYINDGPYKFLSQYSLQNYSMFFLLVFLVSFKYGLCNCNSILYIQQQITAVVILSSNYNNLGTMEYNRTKEAANML